MDKEERKVKNLCRTIKTQLEVKIDSFKTDLELSKYVESVILKEGLKVAFPTCCVQDHMVSNYSPVDTSALPLNGKILTVDFGIRDSKNRIVDNAVTIVRDKIYMSFLRSYRCAILNVQKQIRSILRVRELRSLDLSRLISKYLDLEVLSFCGAHVIEEGNLHGSFIPMSVQKAKDFPLNEKRFTIEPHVLIPSNGKTQYYALEGTIVRDKDNYFDTIDRRLGNLKNQVKELYEVLCTNKLSFYEENTYTIRKGVLSKLT